MKIPRAYYGLIVAVLVLAFAPAAQTKENVAAAKHAYELLAKAGKKREDYLFKLRWMDEVARMQSYYPICEARLKNKLDTEDQYAKCKERWRTMPDFWKAIFVKKTKIIPRERCIFTFDNEMNPSDYITQGCGYDK